MGGELWGIADRTDFDLTSISTLPIRDLSYVDSETGEKHALFCDRAFSGEPIA